MPGIVGILAWILRIPPCLHPVRIFMASDCQSWGQQRRIDRSLCKIPNLTSERKDRRGFRLRICKAAALRLLSCDDHTTAVDGWQGFRASVGSVLVSPPLHVEMGNWNRLFWCFQAAYPAIRLRFQFTVYNGEPWSPRSVQCTSGASEDPTCNASDLAEAYASRRHSSSRCWPPCDVRHFA